MESGKDALQEAVVGNKMQSFSTGRVLLKYDKCKGTIATVRKIWDVK